MSGLETMSREELLALAAVQAKTIELLTQRVAELERRLSADSSNSSRPPSSDAPWEKKPAKKRSLRGRSGRKPGKQPGASSTSRSLIGDPNKTVVIEPGRCQECSLSLDGAVETGRERRQVVDVAPMPPSVVTEYQRVSKRCSCCGTITTLGWDAVAEDDPCRDVVAASGSPVRIGPQTLARAALLTCGHYVPIGRSRYLLEALTGIDVSTGLLAGIRGRAARKLEKSFQTHVGDLVVEVHQEVAGGLGGPGCGGMCGDTEDVDSSGVDLHHEQDVEPVKADGVQWKKSVASRPVTWARRKVCQLVSARRGSEPTRAAARMRRMVPAPRWCPSRVSSPWTWRCPQRGFSRANWTTSSRSSSLIAGRPGRFG